MYRAFFTYKDPNNAGESTEFRAAKPPRHIDLGLFQTYELAAEEGEKIKDHFNDVLRTTFNVLHILKTEE